MYHDGSRRIQEMFDSRRIADRLAQVTVHAAFTGKDREFIEQARMFFLATADAEGRPDCSFKGGLPGFVRVTGEAALAWPDYDGNGMYRSLGNIAVNPRVQLLFVDFERPRRMRVEGAATLHRDDPVLATMPGAKLVVRLAVDRIFPNCPRYIPRAERWTDSMYSPGGVAPPPEPEWKSNPEFKDHLPRERRGG